MKKLLNLLGLRPQKNDLFELVLELAETSQRQLDNIEVVETNRYRFGDAVAEVSYFPDGHFDEIKISFGYTVGKGLTLVLRNYLEHSVIINHDILGSFVILSFAIPTESFALQDYRTKLDDFALDLISEISLISPEMGSDLAELTTP